MRHNVANAIIQIKKLLRANSLQLYWVLPAYLPKLKLN
ncbi:hypothetical protein PARC_a1153 [Pseudoalteromonas arctica A 37-1-2]|uniref:Uncharacterized protein n=1 Tax=Pseudoalteromonas arctica A 37-1-2 TaxID=1117313 RepID=A0A290S0W8_9GAMM|nr:hypothetical protein PARC_a1153 [Pseudoalteromonas arctica A 37-1-2]